MKTGLLPLLLIAGLALLFVPTQAQDKQLKPKTRRSPTC
jgi:hypothetical protein